MIKQRIILPLYLLTLLLIGLGYLAILPVFEGFDENAHYSSIRQIADTKTIPAYGASFLDQEVIDYPGPIPYNSSAPPFDKGLTYSKFFAQPDLLARYVATSRQTSASPSEYKPAIGSQNWQAQHPPLYYALLAPVEKLTEHVSFVTRVFLLRLTSYLLALGGVLFGFLASRDPRLDWRQDPAVIGFMLYPIILPMFFPEFTRIGNDSLCLFLSGVVAYLFTKHLNDENQWKWPVMLGITMGLGLLTKAFFLPIAAALLMFYIARQILLNRKKQSARSVNWKNLGLMLLPAAMIGGGWYLYNFSQFGTPVVSADFAGVSNWHSVLVTAIQHFPLSGVMHGMFVTLMTWSWAGTWSLTRLPMGLHKPLLALVAWVFVAFAWRLRRRPVTDGAWLPVLLLLTFGSGLLYHIVISVIVNGDGNTPGWYLHILMPWFAPILGVGVLAIGRHSKARLVLVALLFYAMLFQIMAIWSQFALFTGCAIKSDAQLYAFPNHAFCLNQTSVLMDRLSIYGWPALAALGFCGGLAFIVAMLAILKPFRQSDDRDITSR